MSPVIHMMDTIQIDCDTCFGSGEIVDDWRTYAIVKPCSECEGMGYVEIEPETDR